MTCPAGRFFCPFQRLEVRAGDVVSERLQRLASGGSSRLAYELDDFWQIREEPIAVLSELGDNSLKG